MATIKGENKPTAPLVYNPFDPEVHADPYPHYRQLREQDPVHRSEVDLWVLTRYDDIAALLRDPRLGHEVTQGFAEGGSADWESMLFRDPPAHTRLRSLVSKAFTPRVLESLKTRIHNIVDDALGIARENGTMDVIGDLAFPLPATVISEMLGLPVEDHEKCRRWAASATRSLDPLVDDRIMDEIFLALIEFRQYLAEQVERRRAQPGEDLVTALIAAEEQGERLSHEELISTLLLLFTAGHETATNLIGNGLLALLRNPDQLRRLKQDPGLMRPGIEELLRYDSPVQFVIRIVKEPMTVRGQDFVRGDSMLLVIGAGNRDPEQFADPDVLDVGRKDNKHLSFGGGIHFCLGSVLARMEAQAVLGALISQFSELELAADDVRWRPHINLRGLEALPIRVG
jgi:pimeloyl-[acyl-carrier protein] synthase